MIHYTLFDSDWRMGGGNWSLPLPILFMPHMQPNVLLMHSTFILQLLPMPLVMIIMVDPIVDPRSQLYDISNILTNGDH